MRGTIVCLAEPCALFAVPIITATVHNENMDRLSVMCMRKIVNAANACIIWAMIAVLRGSIRSNSTPKKGIVVMYGTNKKKDSKPT